MSKIEQGNLKYLARKTIIDILFVCFLAQMHWTKILVLALNLPHGNPSDEVSKQATLIYLKTSQELDTHKNPNSGELGHMPFTFYNTSGGIQSPFINE